MKRLIKEEQRALARECLPMDLLNSEKQRRILGESDSLELAHCISLFRVKLQRDSGMVAALIQQKT
jgi:hypothetical protein